MVVNSKISFDIMWVLVKSDKYSNKSFITNLIKYLYHNTFDVLWLQSTSWNCDFFINVRDPNNDNDNSYDKDNYIGNSYLDWLNISIYQL